MEFTKPLLIEPGVKYFLSETLKKCHVFNESHNIFLFNLSLFIGFLIILGVVLLFKYKGKLTPKEIQNKDNEKCGKVSAGLWYSANKNNLHLSLNSMLSLSLQDVLFVQLLLYILTLILAILRDFREKDFARAWEFLQVLADYFYLTPFRNKFLL